MQGAIHVKQQYGENVLAVFIEPPTIEELKRRLESRGTETEESVQTRLSKASYELSFKHQFSKIIMNDDLEKACKETEMVIKEFLGW